MNESVTRQLGRLIAGTPSDAIPERVRERARISLVHNITVALAGNAPAAQAYALVHHAGPQGATLLGNGAQVAPEAAAFANAARMNARSQDDTQAESTSHPGAPVMAAALALAETQGATGREFLDAVIMGYEALCRIGRDIDEDVTARGFRAAAVFAPFGAVGAAARLSRLDARQTAHALGFAAQQAGGTAQVWVEGSPEFQMQMGLGAQHGVQAARLAAQGMQSADYAIEGPKGLHATFGGSNRPPVEALAGLGEDWQLDSVTVKAFPVCAILQGPLALLQRMLEDESWPDVAAITLTLSPYEASYPGIDNPGRIASPTQAKMSAQFCLGAMAALRRLRFDDLRRLDDPAILSMAPRVTVVADPATQARLSGLRIDLADGRCLSGVIPEPAGRPDFDGVAAFAHRMAPETGLTEARTQTLIDTVREIDTLKTLAPLMAACTL